MDEQQFGKGVDPREYAEAGLARAYAVRDLALLYGSQGRVMDEQQREQKAAELLDRIREATERLQPWHRFQHDLRQAMRQARAQAIAELGYDPAPPRPRPRAPKVAGVTARCGRCSRSLGHHAPALAILERVDGPQRWVIRKIATWGRDFADEDSPRAEHRILPGAEDAISGERRLRRPDGIQLACRRCRHKPRRKSADLHREADEAVAKGQDYFYV
jgi:hypothetical protein